MIQEYKSDITDYEALSGYLVDAQVFIQNMQDYVKSLHDYLTTFE